MACILCRLICGPKKMAAMEQWINAPWNQPNNGESFFHLEQEQDALRAVHLLRKTEPGKAFQEFLRFAEQGSVWSMYQVGVSLLSGLGTDIDKLEAEKWLRCGYEAGDEAAMLKLADLYLRQKRYNDAGALLVGYAENNYSPALYLLGHVHFQAGKKQESRAMFEKAAALGHRRAKWSLAKACAFGKFGLMSILYGFSLGNELGDEFRKSEIEVTSKSEFLQNEAAVPSG